MNGCKSGDVWLVSFGCVAILGKKRRYFAFSCQKIYIYQKNAVSLQQQTYPASRKISALRVSLFYYYGTLHRQTTFIYAADCVTEEQWTHLHRWAESLAHITANQLFLLEELHDAADERQSAAYIQEQRYRLAFAALPLPLMVLAVAVAVLIAYQFITADMQPFIYFQFWSAEVIVCKK